jgi:hypothetical protein
LKLVVLAAAMLLETQRVWLCFAVIAIGSVVSHMPGRLRHRRLFG